MGQQRRHGVESQQTERRALYGPIRSLLLGLEAQMGAAFLAGRFNAPALDEWSQAAFAIAHQYPAHRQHRPANPIPHPCPAGHCQLPAAAVVPAHAYALPRSLASLSTCFSCGKRSPLTRRCPLVPGVQGGTTGLN